MDIGNPQHKVPCPSCGRLVDAAASYCNYCGKPITPPPPPDYYSSAQYAQVPGARRMSGWTIGCIAVAVVATLVVFIGIMFASALPNYMKVKEKAKEAEGKASLHNIQLAVERFGVDHEGSYPQYLIGGEGRAAANVNAQGTNASAFQAITDCPTLKDVADPLLAGGYLDAYPRNPFERDPLAIQRIQENLPSAEFDGCDPLRNTTADGAQYGTRFGAHCDLMGSVLADPRYRVLGSLGPPPAGGTPGQRTYADIEYDFWDMWTGRKPQPYLPGQFFYKSMGPFASVNPQPANPVFPTDVDQYMLGVYGGIHTKGKDVLGEEWTAPASQPGAAQGNAGTAAQGGSQATMQPDVWCMTRSQVSNDLSKREGSPYGVDPNAAGPPPFSYGNPNGFRDALVLILTAGESYQGNP